MFSVKLLHRDLCQCSLHGEKQCQTLWPFCKNQLNVTNFQHDAHVILFLIWISAKFKPTKPWTFSLCCQRVFFRCHSAISIHDQESRCYQKELHTLAGGQEETKNFTNRKTSHVFVIDSIVVFSGMPIYLLSCTSLDISCSFRSVELWWLHGELFRQIL